MPLSSLTYKLARNYPYRWVTPVAIIGGIIALILISILNFASNGYELSVSVSTQKNATEARRVLDDWPKSLTGSNARAQCQSSIIPINTKLFTNNTALSYTLNDVVQSYGGQDVHLASLIYSDNLLESCEIHHVDLSIEHSAIKPCQAGVSWFNVDAKASVSCSLDSPAVYGALSGPSGTTRTTINLTAEYNWVPADTSCYKWAHGDSHFKFIGRNMTTQSSLWWGESLLSVNWALTAANASAAMFNISAGQNPVNTKTDDDYPIGHDGKYLNGEYGLGISFIPHKASSGSKNLPSISDTTFFNIEWLFTADELNGLGNLKGWTQPNLTENIINGTYPNVWQSADQLAKSLYSTILTDLGQISAPNNILVDPALVTNFTSGFTSLFNITGPLIGAVGPSTLPYSSTNNTYGKLEVRPSTLATSYVCQIPKLKPTAQLLWSILQADIVFLNVLWLLFTFALSSWVQHRDPAANYCDGCKGSVEARHEDGSELVLLKPPRAGATEAYDD